MFLKQFVGCMSSTTSPNVAFQILYSTSDVLPQATILVFNSKRKLKIYNLLRMLGLRNQHTAVRNSQSTRHVGGPRSTYFRLEGMDLEGITEKRLNILINGMHFLIQIPYRDNLSYSSYARLIQIAHPYLRVTRVHAKDKGTASASAEIVVQNVMIGRQCLDDCVGGDDC